MHPNVKDLTGKTFGRLLVVGPAPRPEGSKGRGQHWECFCECLQEVVVRSDSLVQGWTTSCGCLDPIRTRARSFIKPRRPKSPASEHPESTRPKSTSNENLSMSENQGTYSNTIGVKLEELIALRNKFDNMTAANMLDATRAAKAWLDEAIAKHNVAKQHVADLQDALFPDISRHINPPSCGDKVREPTEQEAREGDGRTRLRFADPQDVSTRKHSHYFKPCPFDAIDVYRVLALFGVTDQALGHAIKKMLVAGGRGAGKSIDKDIAEAIDTLTRWQEMRREEANAKLFMSVRDIQREEGYA